MSLFRTQGMGVSSGVAVGRIFLLHAEPLPVVPNPIPPERVEDEVDRFDRARDAARAELEDLRAQVLQALGDPYAGIFDAQKMILDDPGLVAQTQRRIRIGRVSARWALKESVAEFTRKFEAVHDEYIRERGGELADVHRRLQRLLRGELSEEQPVPEGDLVVVAHTIGPSDTMLLAREQVVGLATDVGGRTSHTAILAQALSLPAVVGLRDLSRRVRAGDNVVIDGDSGEVILHPDESETAAAMLRRQEMLDRELEIVSARDLPAVTADGVEITVRANIEFPSEVERANRYGAQGIGLYRSEFLFLSCAPGMPSEDQHYETYLQIARSVEPQTAVIRTLDLGGEKYFHDVLRAHESHPVLGLRGVRFCLHRPEVFRPQLRGLLRAAARQSNLCTLLPMVTSVDEVLRVRAMLAEEADALQAEGIEVRRDLLVGVMIEVPAAALISDLLAPHADFFSLGTNDLVQYALAVDRGNERLSALYQPRHPGMLRLIAQVVASARDCGIPIGICGELAADVGSIELLIGLGLRELSVQPRSVGAVRDAVRRITVEQAENQAAEAMGRPGPARTSGGSAGTACS